MKEDVSAKLNGDALKGKTALAVLAEEYKPLNSATAVRVYRSYLP